ncbi:glycosyltransferase family 1 protein [Cellvibrio sp. PSBB023]|uniref:glycosyltransferase family 4 protein n=1 Tax=Cellvibrio sp. PSBB023 TaxID=1945512 RepID=UPI00098EE265|nr:glycosyltransferase family 1 protein [Cellvibrio sp. PSBB023]
MLKIVVDATLINRETTGIGNVTKSLVSGLQAHNHPSVEFNFLVPKGYKTPTTLPASNAIFTPVKKWQRYVSASLPVADVWHSSYQHFRYFRKTANTKQVITIHDLNFLYEKRPTKAQKHLRKMQRRIDRADALVAISEFVANDIRNHLDIKNKPLEVIYNAVENLQGKEARKPAFHTQDKPFFFALGAMRRKKNFHVLVDMMQKFPEYQLYICGNKDHLDYAHELEARIKQLNLTNVALVGPITAAEKIWLYQHAEAFLFPSLFEGFGLPILEAMQFGTPVFTSNMTSLPEVSGGYAFIWDNFETDYLSKTLHEHLPLMQQDQQKQEDMKNYATSFTLERNIHAYVNLYQHLAGNINSATV